MQTTIRKNKMLASLSIIFFLISVCAVECAEELYSSDLYAGEVQPMPIEKCMQCHPLIAQLLISAGARHAHVECRECHLQVHSYFPGKNKYEDILPKCARCHEYPHGEELVNCSNCHQEAHAPLFIPASNDLGQGCYVCHEKLTKDMNTFVTQHTEFSCTACHHTRHGKTPECLECHQGHKGSPPSAGAAMSDLTPLGQCLNCHPPHKALKVIYPDDTPDTACAYCHRKASAMLAKTISKHSALQCIQCHPQKHRNIKRCKECHGNPHPEEMTNNFNTCGQCHGVAHSIVR